MGDNFKCLARTIDVYEGEFGFSLDISLKFDGIMNKAPSDCSVQ